MSPTYPTDTKRSEQTPDQALARYVAAMRSAFAKYELPLDQARKAVDNALGQTRLTDLLYTSRNEDGM